MRLDDSGRSRAVVVLALLVATVAVAAVAGLALGTMDQGDGDRTGEEILSDVSETYDDADSVASDAVVTVEVANRTTEFEVSAAAAGQDRKRVNVSSGGHYTVTGVDGNTTWLYDPTTGLTGVIDRSEDTVTASLRAGTEQPAVPGLSVVPGDIGLDTELSTVLASFDGDVPENLQGELDGLPENATVGDLLNNDSVGTDMGGILNDTSGERPDEWADIGFSEGPDDFELPDEWENFELPDEWENFELPDEWDEYNHSGEWWDEYNHSGEWWDEYNHSGEWWDEYNHSEKWGGYEPPEGWAEYELPEEWELSELRERLDEWLAGEFNTSAITVERVGTETIDGQEANELLLSHPDFEWETRLWVDAESDTLLELETTAPNLRVTVDVRETRFDVSPADSTFEPPGTTEVASLSLSATERLDTFRSAASFETAVPGGDWQFEGGAVVAGEAPSLTAMAGVEPTDVATAAYTDGESSVAVSQSNRSVDWGTVPLPGTETVTVGDREVLLVAGEYLSVGLFSADGTTVAVAGDLSGEQLQSVIAGIELDGPDA